MRKTIVFGALALSLALGAGAASADNANVPSWSAYAMMGGPAPGAPSAYGASAYPMEARAAYVAMGPNGNVASWSPYTVMPQAR